MNFARVLDNLHSYSHGVMDKLAKHSSATVTAVVHNVALLFIIVIHEPEKSAGLIINEHVGIKSYMN